jgi:hypothetical protein
MNTTLLPRFLLSPDEIETERGKFQRAWVEFGYGMEWLTRKPCRASRKFDNTWQYGDYIHGAADMAWTMWLLRARQEKLSPELPHNATMRELLEPASA